MSSRITLVEQILSLSAGTLSTLSKLRNYHDVDRLRMKLVDCARLRSECQHMKRWQELVKWYYQEQP